MTGFCPLFSGSSGNCTYIGTDTGGVLIDVGVSARRVETALRERGIDPRTIHTLCITHEHTDHVAGVRVFAQRYGCRIVASAGTLDALATDGRLPAGVAVQVMPDGGMTLGDLYVRAFSTAHDSRQSCGYRVQTPDDCILAVATDTGYIPPSVAEALFGCDVVLIESNHDVHMLKTGPYPYFLKQRVLADTGHLSNACCAALLPDLVRSGTTYVYLGHLSADNNRPSLAYETAQTALRASGMMVDRDLRLAVAPRAGGAPVLRL